MNRPRPVPPDQEAIEAMAAAWLAQRDDGLTNEEVAEFARWQQADPRHAAAVARLEKTWAMLQPLREFRPEGRVHPNRDLLANERKPAAILTFPRAAALAGLAAAVAIGFIYFRPAPPATLPVANQSAQAPATYATTPDSYQRVTLSDGSVLQLNANTEARVEMLPQVRHVHLVRGEAHFTVAKNPRRPFIVHAEGIDVRAVGTAFNVRHSGGGIEVLVTEGRVHVERHAGGPAEAPLPELGVGDRLLIPTGSSGLAPQVENLGADAMQRALAWQGPHLRFVETPLAAVVAQFNEHNEVKVELGDATLATVPIDGQFRPDNVEAFIRLFEADPHSKILVERVAPDRIILRRAP